MDLDVVAVVAIAAAVVTAAMLPHDAGGQIGDIDLFSRLLFALSACAYPFLIAASPIVVAVGEILFPSPSAWDEMERRWQKVTFASWVGPMSRHVTLTQGRRHCCCYFEVHRYIHAYMHTCNKHTSTAQAYYTAMQIQAQQLQDEDADHLPPYRTGLLSVLPAPRV